MVLIKTIIQSVTIYCCYSALSLILELDLFAQHRTWKNSANCDRWPLYTEEYSTVLIIFTQTQCPFHYSSKGDKEWQILLLIPITRKAELLVL